MENKLKLVRWVEDGFPPINLNENVPEVAKLVYEIKRLTTWTKCSDKLPEKSGDYLVCYEGQNPETCSYWLDGKKWVRNKPLAVTHWMELPPEPTN